MWIANQRSWNVADTLTSSLHQPIRESPWRTSEIAATHTNWAPSSQEGSDRLSLRLSFSLPLQSDALLWSATINSFYIWFPISHDSHLEASLGTCSSSFGKLPALIFTALASAGCVFVLQLRCILTVCALRSVETCNSKKCICPYCLLMPSYPILGHADTIGND
jgi:hypothetical protein